MEQKNELKVTFSVSGIPDRAGLRIRVANPFGLYISSRDEATAQLYFEMLVIQMVIQQGVLVAAPGGGWSLKEKIDWPASIASGKGEVVVYTTTRAEMMEIKKTGHPIIMPSAKKLIMENWQGPNGHDICIAYEDIGGMMDGWIPTAIKEDLGRLAATH